MSDTLTADDLTPGTHFVMRETECCILREPEPCTDTLGRPMTKWWVERLDTGEQGYIILGPSGVVTAA